jgi:predicted transcriptional regulator
MQNEPFGPSLEPSAVRTIVFRRRGKALCGGRLAAPSYWGDTQEGRTSGSALCRRLRLNGWAASSAGHPFSLLSFPWLMPSFPSGRKRSVRPSWKRELVSRGSAVEMVSGYATRQVPPKRWAFITHHAQVLLAVASNPSMRVEEIADAIGITERCVYKLLSDLQKAGYIRRTRNGRRNTYELSHELELGDPLIEKRPLGQLLTLMDRN